MAELALDKDWILTFYTLVIIFSIVYYINWVVVVNKVGNPVLANCLWRRHIAVCKDKIHNFLYNRKVRGKSLKIKIKDILKKNLLFYTS